MYLTQNITNDIVLDVKETATEYEDFSFVHFRTKDSETAAQLNSVVTDHEKAIRLSVSILSHVSGLRLAPLDNVTLKPMLQKDGCFSGVIRIHKYRGKI